MKRSLYGAMFLVVAGTVSAPSVSAEETLDSVVKRIESSWAKVRTLSARTKFENMHVSGDVRMSTKYDGVYWHMKRDNKELYRYDMQSTMTMSVRDESRSQPTQKRILVGDGEYVYNQTSVYGIPVAEKVGQLESGIGMGGKSLLDYVRNEQYVLSYLRSDKIGKEDVYVLEGVHRQAGRALTMVCYISKESGMLVRRETFRDNKIKTRLTVSDIDINEELSPDLFSARPSADIGVVDRTGKKKEMNP